MKEMNEDAEICVLNNWNNCDIDWRKDNVKVIHLENCGVMVGQWNGYVSWAVRQVELNLLAED